MEKQHLIYPPPAFSDMEAGAPGPFWLFSGSGSGDSSTGESPSAAVVHTSQFSLRAINQPRGPVPPGVARWSVMVLFLQTVEGHPRRTWQAIILRTPPSPLLLPTASGPVASSHPRLTPSLPFMNSPPVSSSFISSALLSREHWCN